MEKDDLDLWYNTSDHDDDVADYVFLCDTDFEWIRLSKFQIMIENRSRKLTIQVCVLNVIIFVISLII